MGPMSPHIAAIVEFTRMYQNKTGHNWFWVSAEERRQPKVGSYGELDIDYSQSVRRNVNRACKWVKIHDETPRDGS